MLRTAISSLFLLAAAALGTAAVATAFVGAPDAATVCASFDGCTACADAPAAPWLACASGCP